MKKECSRTLTPHYNTLQQCLDTIKNCERLINSGKLSVLHHFRLRRKRCYHTMMQGESLSYHLRSKHIYERWLSPGSLCDNTAYGVSASDLYFDKLQTELCVIFLECLCMSNIVNL